MYINGQMLFGRFARSVGRTTDPPPSTILQGRIGSSRNDVAEEPETGFADCSGAVFTENCKRRKDSV